MMQQNENKKAGAVAATLPSRKELTFRALNYLANEEAITRLNANTWEIYDDYIKGF